MPENKPWLEAVDHISYVVSPESIRKWAWFYIDVLGGKLTKRIDDANPNGKSSMMLWEIDFGKFAIALVAGIDREEISHVSAFNAIMGDRAVQHIAFRAKDENLEKFIAHLAKYGMRFQGEMLTRPEGSGTVMQIFGAPVNDEVNSADSGFDEFQARPAPDAPITFSAKTAAELYETAQALMKSGEVKPMLDWSRMPQDWEPPEVAS
ncbi:MAG: VOC family protein [Candidatus Spechtbacterales bacterium]